MSATGPAPPTVLRLQPAAKGAHQPGPHDLAVKFSPNSTMNRRTLLSAVMALVASAARASPPDALDPLPRWDYEELVSAATAGLAADEIKDVRLLMWQTQEDGRPLRFDAALLWIRADARHG